MKNNHVMKREDVVAKFPAWQSLRLQVRSLVPLHELILAAFVHEHHNTGVLASSHRGPRFHPSVMVRKKLPGECKHQLSWKPKEHYNPASNSLKERSMAHGAKEAYELLRGGRIATKSARTISKTCQACREYHNWEGRERRGKHHGTKKTEGCMSSKWETVGSEP